MSSSTDDPLVLLEILEVLGACRGRLTYADVCVYLSGRYELQPLLELRSLLYSTACRDPCFPATLFRERLHPPCSNRLSAAADVVSLFNLLTHTRLPPSRAHTSQPGTSCLACGQGCARCDWTQAEGGAVAPGCKYEGSTEGLITQTPSHLLVHSHLHPRTRASMQCVHSLDTPSDCSGNQESASKVPTAASDTDPVHSCAQKRSVFKGEFHNLLPLMETSGHSEQAQEGLGAGGEDVHFLTCKNPYPDSTVYTHDSAEHLHDALTHAHNLPAHTHNPAAYTYMHATQTTDSHSQGSAAQRHDALSRETHAPATDILTAAHPPYHQKHKSLDDLQSSTYFGPTVMERTHQSPAMTAKSHSLDIDSRSDGECPEHDTPGLHKANSRRPGSERSALDKSGLNKPGLSKSGFEGSSFDIPGFDPFIVRSVRDTLKRLSGLSLDAWYDWSPDAEGVASVATQTELPDRRALRSLMLSDRLSIDNPDIAEDDISAIFRFLDDISMCGSMAVLPGEGGGAQEGGGAGLPERRERLGKLRRLFHSLEGPEEGVRWGVGRLLQRVTELEQRLEPISELREQLALVLSTLNRLEQRGQLIHTHLDLLPVDQLPAPEPSTHQQGELMLASGPEGAAAKRRGLFTRRASRSHTESNSSLQHREWSISFSKEQRSQPTQTEQQGVLGKKEIHPVQERRNSHLILQSHQAPLRSCIHSPTLRPSERPKVSWRQSELTPLDLQTENWAHCCCW
ncbi:major intrinsically disordered Notch2-binding receptor 1 isoform X2 [Brachyhypopomus gauderio]|uniref:major intrinsically disordered Notch2-binding receptor 1 isoform X2 n=1 Tax=Brachyhypopomus gauderio TaxID=698409 RepID=UPI0040436A36